MSDNFDDISTVREESTFVIDTDKEYKSQTKEENIGGYHPTFGEADEKEVSPLRKHFKVVIGLTLVMLWYTILNFLQASGTISPGVGLILCFPPVIIGLIVLAYIRDHRLQ